MRNVKRLRKESRNKRKEASARGSQSKLGQQATRSQLSTLPRTMTMQDLNRPEEPRNGPLRVKPRLLTCASQNFTLPEGVLGGQDMSARNMFDDQQETKPASRYGSQRKVGLPGGQPDEDPNRTRQE